MIPHLVSAGWWTGLKLQTFFEAAEPTVKGLGLASGFQTHLCFSFITCKMGLVAVPSSWGRLSESKCKVPGPEVSVQCRLTEKSKERREGGREEKQGRNKS